MATATTYLDRVLPAIDRLAGRFTDLVTSVPDPSAAIPGSDWTVRDAAAHVVTVTRRFVDRPEGRGTWVADPRDLGALNDAQIEALAGLDVRELAARLRGDLTALAAQVRAYGGAPPSFTFHGGEEVAADVALGILLGELVVHGWDIARVTGHPWPIDGGDVELILEGVEAILPGWVDPAGQDRLDALQDQLDVALGILLGELVVHGWDIARVTGHPWPIDGGDVELILEGVEAILPGWVDRDAAGGLTATFEVRLRGGGTHVWSFRGGRLEVAPAGRRPDVRISTDPVALLLVFYRRQSQWRHIARGRMLAWGRRPWLAFTLAGRFHKP